LATALLLRAPTPAQLTETQALVRRNAGVAIVIYAAWTGFTVVPALLRDRSFTYYFFAVFMSQYLAWAVASGLLRQRLLSRGLRYKRQDAAWIGLPVMIVVFIGRAEGERWILETFNSVWWLVALGLVLFWLLHLISFYGEEQRSSVRLMAAAEARLERLARARAEAELRLLQGQVEPHFLYNTLANLRYLVQTRSSDALVMTDALIDYLRASVPSMRANQTTIQQEAEQVQHYLTIMQMRMQGRLAFAIDVDDTVRSVPLPPLVLLTLVENAIKHGIAPQVAGGRVDVSARRFGERVRIEVVDTGAGFEASAASSSSTRAGLANIRERLKLTYGEEATLGLSPNEPHGVRATLELPCAVPTEAVPARELPPAPVNQAVQSHSLRRSWLTEVDGLSIRATLIAPGEAELWINEVLEDMNAIDPTASQAGQAFLFAAVPSTAGRIRRIRVERVGDGLKMLVDGQEVSAVAYVETQEADESQSNHRG
jgi:signal transduction histidine kinase